MSGQVRDMSGQIRNIASQVRNMSSEVRNMKRKIDMQIYIQMEKGVDRWTDRHKYKWTVTHRWRDEWMEGQADYRAVRWIIIGCGNKHTAQTERGMD